MALLEFLDHQELLSESDINRAVTFLIFYSALQDELISFLVVEFLFAQGA